MSKLGRPPFEITQEILDKAESYAARGLNQQQIADALGICIATLHEKKNSYTDFSDAIKRGKSRGIALVADNLLNNVKNGNVTAQIFYLKCQANWKEASAIELTGKDGGPIATANIHQEAAEAKVKKFMEKIFSNKDNGVKPEKDDE